MTNGDSRGEETTFRSRARSCESCRAAPCAVFCRVDSVYLCAVCDARLHAAHSLASRHERVWMCEVCECAPAALTCKADAAALCAACDADIHSANPLARRHHRTPILAISERLFDEEKEEEDASLLLLDPGRNQNGGELLYGGEVNDYPDLVEYGSCTENHYHDNYDQANRNQKFSQCQQQQNQTKNDGSDGVVPVQFLEIKTATLNQPNQQNQERMGIEFESSNLSHSVSLSSMDAVVVPDNAMTDISNSHIESCKATVYHSAGPLHIPPQFTAMDREARVLRYREKRKNRKFEKTIRYASRKAYAETRPRIKGRFAKRIDVEVEVDQIFSVNLLAETGYGVVPSF